MDNVIAYILLTTALAVLQVRENYNAYLAKQRAESIGISFTLFEICWVFVSLVFLFVSDASKLEASVAVFYIAINVCGWIAGHYLYKTANISSFNLSGIPNSFFFVAMFVCAVLFFFGVFVLFQSVPTRRDTPVTQFLFSNVSILVWVPTSFFIFRELIVTLARHVVTKINHEMLEAIENNDTCSAYFGEVLTATLDSDLTEENTDEFAYAYHIVGSERSGTVVAHFASLKRTKHIILFGVIIAEDGEQIEINEVGLHA